MEATCWRRGGAGSAEWSVLVEGVKAMGRRGLGAHAELH